MHWTNAAAVALVIGLAACAEADNSGEAATPDPAQPANSSQSHGLPSADSLAGEWCFERYTVAGEVSDENITYIFNRDGTLLYQNNSSTPVDRPGTFEMADGKLVIKPALAAFPFHEASTTDDGMILRTTAAEFHWTRGPCSG